MGNRTRVPGVRSRAWLKAKLTLEVTVTGGSGELVRSGDWGVACWMRLAYRHPRTGVLIENREAVRVPRGDDFELASVHAPHWSAGA